MLTIVMQETGPIAAPVVSQLSLIELFRTVRVFGEVPFIEPSAGTLLNLTHVERIYDDAPEETSGNYGPGQPRKRHLKHWPDHSLWKDGMRPAEPHDGDRIGCSICPPTKIEQEDEQADVTACPHGYLRYTCSICTPALTGVPQYRGKS